ncbi:hypothetical protein CH298_02775 [Rhodococcoides fascians]|nr:hypothetical protein [Rhodococcus fascians]OZE92770.1 hypothetical protein CH303_02775 [Rhodococcus fascians]OZF23403.1 hypothetical protein CH298_02775 [Rhodococcus fascians]OZF25117.1 hypothetical protein CH297_02775 [Rhodococcus fascians]OZF72685.1 hypothetical protein CH308_02780 [Rhodococcus fascians]OZF73984.1 hypothetical protein CH307_02775 [Rhodococcus fascians]
MTRQVHERWPFLAEGTLRFWRMQGGKQGPPSFMIGRKVLYRASEVEKWLAAQEAATVRGGAA